MSLKLRPLGVPGVRLARLEEAVAQFSPSGCRRSSGQAAPEPLSPTQPTFLNVRADDTEVAAQLGARWDSGAQRWFVPAMMPVAAFARWLPPGVDHEALIAPVYLRCSTLVCHKCLTPSRAYWLVAKAARVLEIGELGKSLVCVQESPTGLVSVTHLEHIDDRLSIALVRHAPDFRRAYSAALGKRVWTNHCQLCHAKLGDLFKPLSDGAASRQWPPRDPSQKDLLLFEKGEFAYVGNLLVD